MLRRTRLPLAVAAATVAGAGLLASSAGAEIDPTGWDRALPIVAPRPPSSLAVRPGLVIADVGGAVVRSVDAGRTWLPTRGGGASGRLLADGDRVVQVAACGVRRSQDAGASFVEAGAVPGACAEELPSGDVRPQITAGALRGDVVLLSLGSQVLASTDGGASFAPRGTAAGGLRDLAFAGVDVVLGVDQQGLLRRSVDAGATWTQVDLPTRPPATGPAVPEPAQVQALDTTGDVVHVGTGSGLLRSADGGVTWAFVDPAGTPPDVPAAARPVAAVACADRDDCLVRFSATPAGASGVNEVTLRAERGVLGAAAPQLPSGARGAGGLLAGAGDGVLVSDDRGTTYRAAPGPQDAVPQRIVDLGDAWAILSRGAGLRFTRDGGRTVTSGGPPAEVRALGGSATDELVAVATDGRLFVGGVDGAWTETGDVTGLRPGTVARSGRRVLVAGGGGVLRSDDLGRDAKPITGRAWSVAGSGRTVVLWRAGALRVSVDGGRRFTARRSPGRGTAEVRVLRDRTLLARTSLGLRTSKDGRRWRTVPGLLRPVAAGAVSARSSRDLLVLSGDALLSTTDSGRSWLPRVAPVAQATALARTSSGAVGAIGTTDPSSGVSFPELRRRSALPSGGRRVALSLSGPRRAVRPARRARSAEATVSGRLTGARLGDRVEIVTPHGGRSVRLSATGTFRTRVSVRRGQRLPVLARFTGDAPGARDARSGAQSRAIAVRARR